jgi:hypothetical protein
MAKQLPFRFDTISWFQAIGLYKVEPETAKTTNQRGNKLWLAGLIAGILGHVHSLSIKQMRITMERKAIVQATNKGDVDEDAEKVVKSLIR